MERSKIPDSDQGDGSSVVEFCEQRHCILGRRLGCSHYLLGSTNDFLERKMRHLTYLSLGSNLGDRELHLGEAIRRLSSVGEMRSVSSLYETEPVEFTDQPKFLNCAVALETSASADQLMVQLLEIEKSMGRQRIEKKGPRIIDLDILLFGDEVVNKPELTIPHPAMHQRRFVLQPLVEIAPDAIHPVLNQTAHELLEDLPPGQSIRRIGTIARAEDRH